WPVEAKQMPGWIGQRLKQAGIRANRAAIDILADRVEGNLLAAVQEIEKLKLLAPEGEIDADTMSTVVADSARYSVFTLVDKILEGDPQGAARNLRGLREDGTDAIVILWALARELRTLIAVQESGEHGDGALRKHGVWDKRQPLVKSALRRMKLRHLRLLLRQGAAIDRAIKGMRRSDPWEDLASLVLGFAGTPTLNAANTRLGIGEQTRAGSSPPGKSPVSAYTQASSAATGKSPCRSNAAPAPWSSGCSSAPGSPPSAICSARPPSTSASWSGWSPSRASPSGSTRRTW